ncbi:hypothetical protein HRI_003867000 [Hibiscus trionum]|uniref:Retrovirus-related Pol polyprotein from transposon TNT 1-94 n=1 Tax=Hibiscus trionum TaxID=183268 RepID=A0A9W7IW30_HIBTR|nr:hypothetical protein HRI_003867000 [Hibiscus trionum]
MNRTLIERVKCLLLDVKFPRSFWAEALNTVTHVINLSPNVPLQGDVLDRVWFGKDVSYDHLRMFGCKAFVHKKLVRDSQDSDELIDVNLVPLDPSPDPIQGNVHGDVNDDQQDIGDLDALMDNVVNDQQHAPIALPAVPLRRSSRNRRSSVRYSSDEYVLLIDGGEPECYEEAMESECKDQWVEAMKDALQSLHENHTFELSVIHLGKNSTFHARPKYIDVRYHWIRDVLEANLLELEKIHTDDNGADMLTKALPRVKFEACCLTFGMEAFPT